MKLRNSNFLDPRQRFCSGISLLYYTLICFSLFSIDETSSLHIFLVMVCEQKRVQEVKMPNKIKILPKGHKFRATNEK